MVPRSFLWSLPIGPRSEVSLQPIITARDPPPLGCSNGNVVPSSGQVRTHPVHTNVLITTPCLGHRPLVH